MFNFLNEIDRSALDRNIRFFLFGDYFHDSVLDRIEWDVRSRVLRLTLWCEREWQGDHGASADERDRWLFGLRRFDVPLPSRRAQANARLPKSRGYKNYVYQLEFSGCEHCTLAGEDNFIEYLNGRFKQSALLVDLQQHCRRRLLHFRMQLADGLADVVFHRFRIERAVGRFRLPKMARSQSSWLDERFGSMGVRKVRRLARMGDEPLRSEAIWFLCLRRDASALRLAIQATEDGLDSEFFPWVESLQSGIAVIGRLGECRHLDLLYRAFVADDRLDYRRHVLDAIEHILSRTNEGRRKTGD